MRWVLEGQTALQVVLVEVHVSSDVLILLNLLLFVEPAQLGVRVTTNREFNAGIKALLRLSQSQDDRRNCSGEGGEIGNLLGIPTINPKQNALITQDPLYSKTVISMPVLLF